ncbi:MAG: hypothetical protein J5998_02205 [Clostridia bacterium]|nr:hypothetical protein [Clostridia bacterium]
MKNKRVIALALALSLSVFSMPAQASKPACRPTSQFGSWVCGSTANQVPAQNRSAAQPIIADRNDAAAQLVAETNAERARYGLKPLAVDADLTAAARIRVREIAQAFSHTRPDGRSCFTVSSKAFGENIARGHNSVNRVMAAWMTSEGHRANILRASYGSIGAACIQVDGIWYWAQLFGR